MYIDGGLPSSDIVKASPFATGVVKSHHTLYVEGENLEAVLALSVGERSSVFVIDSRRRPAVASWYLRVRDAAGESPFWGLVRVEAPLDVMERAVTHEADARSLVDGEPGFGPEVVDGQRRLAPQLEGLGPRTGADHLAGPAEPWPVPAVVEARPQNADHRHRPQRLPAAHLAHHRRALSTAP